MNTRREYEMTESDLNDLYQASESVPYLVAGGAGPRPIQEDVNRAWLALGDRMGFDGMSVRPSPKGDRFFTAIPRAVPAAGRNRP